MWMDSLSLRSRMHGVTRRENRNGPQRLVAIGPFRFLIGEGAVMEHDPSTCVPVYHTRASSDELSEREAAAWVRFGLDVMAAHQPDGDTCQGCGRVWACCPVVVAARQHGLNDDLNTATTRSLADPAGE